MHFRRLNEIAFSSDNKWMAVEVEPGDKVYPITHMTYIMSKNVYQKKNLSGM
jgi:magnesium-transporting ATPase (P-type)